MKTTDLDFLTREKSARSLAAIACGVEAGEITVEMVDVAKGGKVEIKLLFAAEQRHKRNRKQ